MPSGRRIRPGRPRIAACGCKAPASPRCAPPSVTARCLHQRLGDRTAAVCPARGSAPPTTPGARVGSGRTRPAGRAPPRRGRDSPRLRRHTEHPTRTSRCSRPRPHRPTTPCVHTTRPAPLTAPAVRRRCGAPAPPLASRAPPGDATALPSRQRPSSPGTTSPAHAPSPAPKRRTPEDVTDVAVRAGSRLRARRR